jgi:hypothetical protein
MSDHKKNIQDIFTSIYENNTWISSESRSGPGSEEAYTKDLRLWFLDTIPKYNIKSMVDAPCGDFNWMKLVLPKLNIDYIGLDIVESLIISNNQRYMKDNVKFLVCDICADYIPDCDLLMVRDCLFHLSFDDTDKFLKNISKVKFKYLLTTTHTVPETYTNKDIETGGFRVFDIFKPPYKFNESDVIDSVDDYVKKSRHPPRKMVMFLKEKIPTSLS